MSSSVCQGLQSCLEPRIVEPVFFRGKLAPPKSNFPQSFPWPQRQSFPKQQQEQEGDFQYEEQKKDSGDDENKNNKNGELGGWNFIQSLTNTTQNFKEVIETEKVYVHPLFKRSSSTLSTKSLEMCTESLGSETGSDISENIDEFPSLQLENRAIHRSKSGSKKPSRTGNLPPPLSSISGSDNVQVRPHREAGRLVLKAFNFSSSNSFFQAERVDGRLRLCLVRDNSPNCEMANKDEEEVSNEEDFEEDDNVDEGEGEGEEECDDHEDYEDEDDDYWGREMGGNIGKVGGEIEIGELPRPSRCKESGSENKGIPNWGPFWVAIS